MGNRILNAFASQLTTLGLAPLASDATVAHARRATSLLNPYMLELARLLKVHAAIGQANPGTRLGSLVL